LRWKNYSFARYAGSHKRCNANFTVRHTAGDPGFVVDCTWEHHSGRHARYLLPRIADLCLMLVLKDSGDPLDFTHSDHCWRDDCAPDPVALTGPDSALRPGLHACNAGTLYGWSLSGRVPARYDYKQHGSVSLLWPDGREEAWPGTAFVRASHLTHDERRNLEQVVWELESQVGDDSPGYKNGMLATVRKLLDRPVSSPYVAHRAPFPDAGRLNDGEKYLLHRWLLQREERYRLVFAYPVWLVVTAAGGDTGGWRVVRDNLCPRCGRAVLADHRAGDSDDRSHRWCRELWEEMGWQPGRPACPQECGGL
jgi:ribosomal protein S27AE